MKVQILSPDDPLWIETLQRTLYDVYQLPHYVELEAQRQNAIAESILITQDNHCLLIPYLLRQIDPDTHLEAFDIVSPYGYPGFVLSPDAPTVFIEEAFKAFIQPLREKQICSVFLRLHPILNQQVAAENYHSTGETIAIDLTQPETVLWQQTRSDHRKDINRCQREGFTARVVPLKHHIAEFNTIYEEAMDRVKANRTYYFGEAFFAELADLEQYFHLCLIEQASEIVAAGIFTECCGIVHTYLTGTRTVALKRSPDKFMIHTMRSWAKQRGNRILHLGGGLGGNRDRLFEYKAGFSPDRCPFNTLRLITNPEHYTALIQIKAKQLDLAPKTLLQSHYFPAYRYHP